MLCAVDQVQHRTYTHCLRRYVLMYPAGWEVQEDDTTVTLVPRGGAGALTISTHRHRDPRNPVDARRECERFVASQGGDTHRVRGDARSAKAQLFHQDGTHWLVTTQARRGWMLLATFNSKDFVNRDTEAEARLILDSITPLDV